MNFLRNPILYTILVFKKTFIYPKKYKNGEGYAAEQYWKDRLHKYGNDLRGVGEEGRTEKENVTRYRRVCTIFRNFCSEITRDYSAMKVLEIGVGTGQMTDVLLGLGVKDYLGVDITDALFSGLEEKFGKAGFKFAKKDITTDKINERYDLVVIIDVIEHIVEQERFDFAMRSIRDCLTDSGVLIIAPLTKKAKKHQFYERHWAKHDVERIFDGFCFHRIIEWETGFSYIAALIRNK